MSNPYFCPMKMIDTHTHLYVEEFDQDRAAVIERARAAGVETFYLPAIDSAYTERMLTLEQAYPYNIRLMMGLHPTHVKENAAEELAHVKEMLDNINNWKDAPLWDQKKIKQATKLWFKHLS